MSYVNFELSTLLPSCSWLCELKAGITSSSQGETKLFETSPVTPVARKCEIQMRQPTMTEQDEECGFVLTVLIIPVPGPVKAATSYIHLVLISKILGTRHVVYSHWVRLRVRAHQRNWQPQFPRNVVDFKQAADFQFSRRTQRKLMFD
jgi:hypothetical protein